jgi:hypothetical protein
VNPFYGIYEGVQKVIDSKTALATLTTTTTTTTTSTDIIF